MNALAEHYVRVCNDVLTKNVNKTPADLRVTIDEEMYAVDVKIAPKLFVDGWNAATTDPDTVITEEMAKIEDSLFKWKYFWCLAPLIQACRHALADSIAKQFDVVVKSKPYVSDAVRACVCVGLV